MAAKAKSGKATAARPGAWQVKGIEPETRAAVREAARRAGMSIGAWTNEVLHREAVAELIGDRNLPAPVIEDQLAELARRVDRLSMPVLAPAVRARRLSVPAIYDEGRENAPVTRLQAARFVPGRLLAPPPCRGTISRRCGV